MCSDITRSDGDRLLAARLYKSFVCELARLPQVRLPPNPAPRIHQDMARDIFSSKNSTLFDSEAPASFPLHKASGRLGATVPVPQAKADSGFLHLVVTSNGFPPFRTEAEVELASALAAKLCRPTEQIRVTELRFGFPAEISISVSGVYSDFAALANGLAGAELSDWRSFFQTCQITALPVPSATLNWTPDLTKQSTVPLQSEALEMSGCPVALSLLRDGAAGSELGSDGKPMVSLRLRVLGGLAPRCTFYIVVCGRVRGPFGLTDTGWHSGTDNFCTQAWLAEQIAAGPVRIDAQVSSPCPARLAVVEDGRVTFPNGSEAQQPVQTERVERVQESPSRPPQPAARQQLNPMLAPRQSTESPTVVIPRYDPYVRPWAEDWGPAPPRKPRPPPPRDPLAFTPHTPIPPTPRAPAPPSVPWFSPQPPTVICDSNFDLVHMPRAPSAARDTVASADRGSRVATPTASAPTPAARSTAPTERLAVERGAVLQAGVDALAAARGAVAEAASHIVTPTALANERPWEIGWVPPSPSAEAAEARAVLEAALAAGKAQDGADVALQEAAAAESLALEAKAWQRSSDFDTLSAGRSASVESVHPLSVIDDQADAAEDVLENVVAAALQTLPSRTPSKGSMEADTLEVPAVATSKDEPAFEASLDASTEFGTEYDGSFSTTMMTTGMTLTLGTTQRSALPSPSGKAVGTIHEDLIDSPLPHKIADSRGLPPPVSRPAPEVAVASQGAASCGVGQPSVRGIQAESVALLQKGDHSSQRKLDVVREMSVASISGSLPGGSARQDHAPGWPGPPSRVESGSWQGAASVSSDPESYLAEEVIFRCETLALATVVDCDSTAP